MDLNDPELEFSDLIYAYQSWVMAVINDEKLENEEKLLTEEIADDKEEVEKSTGTTALSRSQASVEANTNEAFNDAYQDGGDDDILLLPLVSYKDFYGHLRLLE